MAIKKRTPALVSCFNIMAARMCPHVRAEKNMFITRRDTFLRRAAALLTDILYFPFAVWGKGVIPYFNLFWGGAIFC